MNKLTILSLLSIFFIIIIECENNKKNTQLLEIESSLKVINDSIYIARVEKILFTGKNIYITEAKQHSVFIIDEKLNFKNYFGRHGYGPGEFNIPISINSIDNLFFVYNDGTRKIIVYDSTGLFVKDIDSPTQFPLRFALDKSKNIYVSANQINAKGPLLKIDYNGNIIKNFGGWFLPKKKWQRNTRNLRHVFINENNRLICVSCTEPFIEIYNLDGLLIDKIDISGNTYLKHTVKHYKKLYSEMEKDAHSSSFYTLFRDACYYKNSLYLLYYSENKRFDSILKYKIDGHKIRFQKNYKINTRNKYVLKTLCVSDSYIYVYDSYMSQLLKLKL